MKHIIFAIFVTLVISSGVAMAHHCKPSTASDPDCRPPPPCPWLLGC